MATILVIDDSRTDRRLIAQALAAHTILEAADGDNGMATARQAHPDLIILDVVMPRKNGFQICRELRRGSETAGIPIIILTTKDQPTDREWALRQGASAYMSKPFTDEELLSLVGRYV